MENDVIKISDIINLYETEQTEPAELSLIKDRPEDNTKKAKPKRDTLRKYVLYDKYLAKTGNRKGSAIKAGFSETTAHNAKVNIENSLTYKQYRTTLQKNLDKLMPAHKMAQLIASKAQFAGREVVTKEGVLFLQDDSVAHKYLTTAQNILAAEPAQRQADKAININFNSLITEASQ